jgi:hypothetical protein
MYYFNKILILVSCLKVTVNLVCVAKFSYYYYVLVLLQLYSSTDYLGTAVLCTGYAC